MALGRRYVIGRGVERVFERVLMARTVYVVSPWISEPYAGRLLGMVMEGRAFVVTSMSSDNAFYNRLMSVKLGDMSARPGVSSEAPVGVRVSAWYDYGIAIVVLITLILAVIMPVLIIVGVFVLALIIAIADMYARKKSQRQGVTWLDNVRLSPGLDEGGFIHVKLYIADDEAWIGSANMTQASWSRNVDVLVPIDVEVARRIFDEVWGMAKPLSELVGASQSLQSLKSIEAKAR